MIKRRSGKALPVLALAISRKHNDRRPCVPYTDLPQPGLTRLRSRCPSMTYTNVGAIAFGIVYPLARQHFG
ncbi:MAG TPA: hypothetical protein V6C91_03790 [Coleofasciculaceae cyanobacterium]